MAGKKIGILALQGAFLEHEHAVKKCGYDVMQVRKADDFNQIDALIIPGGESTTIIKLMKKYNLDEIIKTKAKENMPIYGTCAGMITLAKEIVDSELESLGLMNIAVKRNAYGRQTESFESELDIEGIGKSRGVFIRAPYVEKVWGDAKILCKHDNKIIMVEENNLLATSFHPELTDCLEVHNYFLKKL